MVEDETQIVQLNNQFYRDRFGKLIGVIAFIVLILLLILSLSTYLYLSKPEPIVFPVYEDWSVQAPEPLDSPYRSTADLLQWVSDVLPKVFTYDFNHYNDQLQAASQYFTVTGWKVFLNQLNNYVNYNNVQTNRMFVNAAPDGAPIILKQGLILGRYGWWVEMPLMITYNDSSRQSISTQVLTLQVLVVRVPTLNNLSGVGIDNVIVLRRSSDLPVGNG